ncbi:alpha/beta fold hydrolase [Roseomonas sp. NAR14]|uniref:Alpha/beta fold hydrolase n=2 Tax=Roseomonas acroporae TaxID=2937791 RepID=A0A9X2BTD7_9PROT|nr:alpha/beta fold hydrolase [Roseomonas acroporae]
MPALAEAGYHVVAPDQRGFGRTTGWDAAYDTDLGEFRTLTIVRDALALLAALGIRQVEAVIGHDAGARIAGTLALARPDVARRVAMMSAPFTGPRPLPFGTEGAPAPPAPDIHAALAALDPPRKHYQWYYATRPANDDLMRCRQGLHDFLRAYYHHKSADWPGNRPHPLRAWVAEELAKLPTYYVMPLEQDMAQTVAPHMPAPEAVAACRWLPDEELAVYAAEYGRTGFQGGLNWYRCNTSPAHTAELQLLAGRTIDVPAAFVSGAQDWGIHQVPGALETMRTRFCTRMTDCHLIEGAGHWVQQEQPAEVVRLLLDFLRREG